MPNEWETYTQGGRKRLRRRPVRYHATAAATTAATPPVIAEVTEPDAADTDYATWTKAELVEYADEQGVDSTGTKADIVARLEADDAA